MVTASAALGSPWACSTAMRSAGSRVSANPIHQHGRHSICHSDAIAHEDTKGRQRSATRSALVGSRRLRGRGALRGIGAGDRRGSGRGACLPASRPRAHRSASATDRSRRRNQTNHTNTWRYRWWASRSSSAGRGASWLENGKDMPDARERDARVRHPGAQWKASTRYQTGAAAARA